MTSDIIHSVFISSTYEDLREERSAVQKAFLMLRCLPIGMEVFGSLDEETWECIKREIAECDYYVVILAGRYGSTAPDGQSYTEKEYDYAREIKKPVLAFVRGNRGSIPNDKTERDPEKARWLEDFIQKVEGRSPVSHFNNPHELASQVTVSFVNMRERQPAVGFIRADRHARLREEITRLRRQLREASRDIAPAPTTLDIHFDEADQRCRTVTQFNGVLPAVFFRLVITNNTGMLQPSCRGFGREVLRGDGSSPIRDNVQLTWATFSYPLPTMIDLTSGEEQNLDVFFIAANGTIGFATPNFVRPGGFPSDFFSLHGPYTFTVTVASNNSAARTVHLILDWRGDWRNAHVRAEIG